MSESEENEVKQQNYINFKSQYTGLLEIYLNTDVQLETHLNEANKLGREAIKQNINILNVTAIHQDCLIKYLENLESKQHLIVFEKANVFFEEILASYQMIAAEFRDAIILLNKRTLEFAGKIRLLQDAVKEKDTLLKEVYHRVKNNLQVVTSLLNLQASSEQSPATKIVLIASASRIKAMALIHEMLYQAANLSSINMRKYINTLLKYLFDIYGINPDKIKLITDIEDISLTIDSSIPCGLVINEIVHNVLKHSFPGGKTGTVHISFKLQDSHIILIIADDGVGMPPQFDINTTTTLGMKLILSLAKQLGGNIIISKTEGSGGTTITLRFPVPAP